MTEDKQAIEAIVKELKTPPIKNRTKDYTGTVDFERLADKILQTLASLGYYKAVEQKLPELENCVAWSVQMVQQDMLSVDAEGCAYRRVYVGGKK